MTLITNHYNVGAVTAVKLAAKDPDGQEVTIVNPDATITLWIGPANVAAANGRQIKAGAEVTMRVRPGEELYGIAASGTITGVQVLISGSGAG